MTARKREVLIRLGLSLGSLAVSLLILEVLFYRYFPQPTYAIKFSPWGFEHIPNISFKHTPESKETVSYLQYNSMGFRGTTEYAIPKPADTLRVAILGDSYAEGAEVDFRFLYGTILEGKLNAHLARAGGSYRRAEVIKAGVYAYDSCQELRLFEAKVMKYRPDLVFVIYTGELDENAAFCRLDQGRLAYVDMSYTKFEYLKRYAIGYLKAKSHLLNYLARVYRYQFGGQVHLPEQLNRVFAYQPPDQGEFVQAASASMKPVEAYTRLARDKVSREPRDTYEHQLLFAIFGRLDALVESYDGQLHLVFSHDVEGNLILAHYAEQKGIAYLDMFSFLRDRGTRPAHLKLDGHWNEYGHYLVGQGLFELIRGRHLGG